MHVSPRLSLAWLLATLLASVSIAQEVHFSAGWRGPTIGESDSLRGMLITEGDILRPAGGTPAFGPLPRPGILISAGPSGLNLPAFGGCVNSGGGPPCDVELDAFSNGRDRRLGPGGVPRGRVAFSIDQFALGQPILTDHPTVRSEAQFGEAGCDVFVNLNPIPGGPAGPQAGSIGDQVGTLDGDGLVSPSGFWYRGLGLVEPNLPGVPANQPDDGDELDALDCEPGPFGDGTLRFFFSLDAAFVDPRTGLPNSGAAAANGVQPADVLIVPTPAMVPAVFASALELGLDLLGPGSDDLDALIVWENGNHQFDRSEQPYDWIGGVGAADMLLFSVRAGSAVVGQPDSIFGAPIMPGDILTVPLAQALGGQSPYPGILIAAEWLGLRTARGGNGNLFADDVDALDGLNAPLSDCNGNGVEDSVDIATGASNDGNGNGVPDECETFVQDFCHCAGSGPCGNGYAAGGGCANSSGFGALLGASGSTSVAADDLVLHASGLPLNAFGLFFMGGTPVPPTPFADGLRCVGGQLFRFPALNAGSSGSVAFGPGVVGASQVLFGPHGQIQAGETRYFQFWVRDPQGPCGNSSNSSNALAITFLP